MHRRALSLVLFGGVLLAGCLSTGTSSTPGGTDPLDEVPAPPRDALAEVEFLGLAWWPDAPRDAIEARVAEGFEPVACFGGDNLDVLLAIASERFVGPSPRPPSTVSLALLTCARSEHERPDANEPPWYVLEGWAGPEHAEFLATWGPAPPVADVRIERTRGGFAFEAQTGSGLLARGEFTTPHVPTPNPSLPDCAPREWIGRAVTARDGVVTALDWTKSESTCSALARIEWPESSPLAALLGASRPPAASWDVLVHEAEYRWQRLGPTS